MARYKVPAGLAQANGAAQVMPSGTVFTPQTARMPTERCEALVASGRLERVEDDAPLRTTDPHKPTTTTESVVTEDPMGMGEDIDLEDLSKNALIAECEAREGLDFNSRWKKSELIEAIEEFDRNQAKTHMVTDRSLNPADLESHSLEDLNLLVNERSGGGEGPYDTAAECIAWMSMDFKE